jgi:hypothetical protein
MLRMYTGISRKGIAQKNIRVAILLREECQLYVVSVL